MFSHVKRILSEDRTIAWILAGGLILQLITCITQVGVSSADQHFQIVEFSLYQLGKPNGAVTVWEIENFVRPTLQVYLFTGYHLLCNMAGIVDPFSQLTILRVLLGLVMFAVFNLLAFHFFGNSDRKILFFVLLLVNFSWVLPYTRTLFSSEMMSSLFFFGAFLLYDHYKERRPRNAFLFFVGFLFCLSFYFRFQAAFSLLGIGVWLVFFEKKYRHILPLALGFLAGMVLNTWLDYMFYKEWVITPYAYFHANIIAGRADYFGRSSFWRYIGLILLVAPAPLFSIVLFVYMLKRFFRDFANPIFLSVVLFILFHSLVGHKEERFLFPVFNVFPLMIGWSLPYLRPLFSNRHAAIRVSMKVLLWFTIGLNVILLAAMTFVPYSQTIAFSEKLTQHFDGKTVRLFSVRQTPFETPSGNQMEFYKIAARNISVEKIRTFSTDSVAQASPEYIAASFNDLKDHFKQLDSLGYRAVMPSSKLLWNVNLFLQRKKMNTINEIWMLYEKSKDF